MTAANLRELRGRVDAEPNAAWADEAVCRRYLRARKGNLDKASAMLRETLQWRREFGVDDLWRENSATVRRESATGKMRVSPSRDRDGRPTLVMCPRLENNQKGHEENLVNLVYHMERATGGVPLRGGSPLARAPDGKLVVVMDFGGYSMRNAPPMKTSRATLSILQDHYPERLHRFLLLRAPYVFHVFFRIISPFIDPGTRQRICFVSGSADEQREILQSSFDLAHLEADLGGELAHRWDPEAYFAEEQAP